MPELDAVYLDERPVLHRSPPAFRCSTGRDYRTLRANVPRISAADPSLPGRPFAEIRALLDERELTAENLVEAHLERIRDLDPVYHGYVVLDPAGARAAAAAADAELVSGRSRGPLHGIPICVKDHLPVAGMRMRMGSGVYDFVPGHDAEIVAAAREAGAVLLGKNGMHQEAIGDPTRSGELASGEHPYNPAYTPCGSSSGTAVAVAAGLAVVGIGGDSGGSVRGPAASCGIVGLKPSYGRLSTAAVPPFMWSADHVGLFGREVAAVAAGMAALGAGEAAEPRAPRLAVWTDDAIDAEVSDALAELRSRLAGSGASLVDAGALDLAGAGDAWLARAKEAWAVHGIGLAAHPERYSEFVRGFLGFVGATPLATYADSFAYAERLRAQLDNALATVDALFLPATPTPGLRWEQWGTEAVYPWYRYLLPLNLSGHPAVSLPCALSSDGMPIAFQLVGRSGDDANLLAVARWCEERIGFDGRRYAIAAEPAR